jgi:transcriptional regulator with XRE-family HTH domain
VAKNFKMLKLNQISYKIAQKQVVPAEEIGQRLKEVRSSMGMTQKQLARLLNVSQQAVDRIERNSGSCRLSSLKKIALALGVKVGLCIYSDNTLEEIVLSRAKTKARHYVYSVNSNMALDARDSASFLLKETDRIARELAENPGSGLWED